MLSNFSLSVLREVIREFNLISSIKGSSKMKKQELIKELQNHVEFNWRNNTLTTKDKKYIFTLPESKKQNKLNETYRFFQNETKRQEEKKQEKKRTR